MTYFLLVPSPTSILLILSAKFLEDAFFSTLLVDPSVFKFVAIQQMKETRYIFLSISKQNY